MAVCKYFLTGNCKFGEKCRYEHPRNQQPQNQNRYSSFQNQGGSRGGERYTGANPNRNDYPPYHLGAKFIQQDLRDERPIWPCSAYGPGRDAPRQLFGGYPLEQSPEELRLRFYLAMASGNTQAEIETEKELANRAQQQVQSVLNDIEGAIQYVIKGKDEHPNRWDICKQGASSTPGGQAPQNPSNPFTSVPSKPTQPASDFGAPAFGQATGLGAQQPQQSSFGQPGFGQASSLGQQSAFGRPNPLGGAAPFGQQAQPGQAPAFGQSTQLGQGTAFGQTSQPGQSSAFGQPGKPPAFGQPSQPSAFGQPSQPGQASAFGAQQSKPAFGQSGQLGQTSAFGQQGQPGQQPSAFAQVAQPGQQQSAFGRPAQLGQKQSAFGQPAQLGQQQPAFGQAAQSTQQAPFSQSPQPQQTPFGQSPQPQAQPFGGAQGASPFAQAQQQHQQQQQPQPQPQKPQQQQQQPAAQPSLSPFGQQAANAFARPSPLSQTQAATPFGRPAQPPQQAGGQAGAPSSAQPSQPSAFSNPAAASPTPNGIPAATAPPKVPTTRDPATNRLLTYAGHPVTYTSTSPPVAFYAHPRLGPVRVWFPDGPPAAPAANLDQAPAFGEGRRYEGESGKAVEAFYRRVGEGGGFEGGVMCEWAPRREWVGFDV